MKQLVRLASVATLLLAVAGPSAKADIVATLTGVTNQGGGVYRYNYNFQYIGTNVNPVTPTATPNDLVVLPTFAYLTGSTGTTAGSVTLAISTANLLSLNGTVTARVIGFPGLPPAAIPGGPITVATFFVDSQSNDTKSVLANYTQNNPATNGTFTATVAAIPEPSQLALAGVVGLFVLGGRVLRRRKA